MLPAGSTDGSTVRLPRAPGEPPKLAPENLKSPVEIVGAALKLPGFAMSCKQICTANAWPFLGGFDGV